jgi:hypothetical protein
MILLIGYAIIFYAFYLFSDKKHNASHLENIKNKDINEFITKAKLISGEEKIKYSSLIYSQPITINKTIFLNSQLYPAWVSNDKEFSDTMLHTVFHEKAHATLLFPYENMYKALYIYSFIIFSISPVSFFTGLTFIIPLYFFLKLINNWRSSTFESLADAVASHYIINIENSAEPNDHSDFHENINSCLSTIKSGARKINIMRIINILLILLFSLVSSWTYRYTLGSYYIWIYSIFISQTLLIVFDIIISKKLRLMLGNEKTK